MTPESNSPATGEAAVSREDQLAKMRQDWDQRAIENARHYVATERTDWTDEEFFAAGEREVQEQILSDMTNICRGKRPKRMKVLEIGCGAGRVTRSLAALFGEVHAVDVSGEMARLARQAVAGCPNATVYQNNGADLDMFSGRSFDFAYSCLVFQHIPSREIIESYVREVYRVLRPGGLFKFQVQGDTGIGEPPPEDTWLGVPWSEEQIVALAARCGFESRYRYAAGEQYFWNWFFKPTLLRLVRRRLGRMRRRLHGLLRNPTPQSVVPAKNRQFSRSEEEDQAGRVGRRATEEIRAHRPLVEPDVRISRIRLS
ncbi:MAG: methyltransferase domain-containing protein [Betaproteobacteria bacterium]|nr:methyltransferase domain-containing protein [Betaproteobacteria bacterium]